MLVYQPFLKQGKEHIGKVAGPKDSYKLDRSKLVQLVETNPDMMLKEYAQILGVSIHAV